MIWGLKSTHLYKVCNNLGSLLWLLGIENLLDCPKARVVKSLSKCHNVRGIDMLILFRPRTTAQLIRLDLGKDWEIQ